AQFAPKIWKAVCDLLGGQDRIRQPAHWSDEFIFNLGIGADKAWTPPTAKAPGWHKDGEAFRHFLDSPELALLTVVCWTDMKHQGGGTFIAPDSVGPVARFLADHPEGILPTDRRIGALIAECKQFVELTGSAGDVVLLHPYMLHAASQNVLRVERAITNQSVRLKEPMNFNRENISEFSAVERGVLRGLGVDRFDFQPTHPREAIVPDRFRRPTSLQ
ncbi:MAG TPA: phytanoyl-CoA dioxygenase family protein, partial [Tepidisphaeraceae bacterium]|nr:phytanoyl-CoA dioxygenase family protein [Tepidisphaeraceae bacterium]